MECNIDAFLGLKHLYDFVSICPYYSSPFHSASVTDAIFQFIKKIGLFPMMHLSIVSYTLYVEGSSLSLCMTWLHPGYH